MFDQTFNEIIGYVSHEHKGDTTYVVSGKDNGISEAIFDFAVSKNLKILAWYLWKKVLNRFSSN